MRSSFADHGSCAGEAGEEGFVVSSVEGSEFDADSSGDLGGVGAGAVEGVVVGCGEVTMAPKESSACPATSSSSRSWTACAARR